MSEPDSYIFRNGEFIPVYEPRPLTGRVFEGPDGTLTPAPKGHRNAAEYLLAHGGGRIDREEVCKRAGNAMRRKLPTHMDCRNTSDTWAIIGGGPSISRCVDEIRRLKRNGANIVSVNKSHDWLLEKGIVPWGHILLDPKEWVADYVKRPRKDVRYFIASQCHDRTFEALKDYQVYLWHAGQAFEQTEEPANYLKTYWSRSPWYVIPGPTTVGLRAIHLGAAMAPIRVRKFHMFGMDSSRSAGAMHAYAKPEAPDAVSGRIVAKLKGMAYMFDTNSHMARQWADFDKFVKQLPDWIADNRLPAGLDLTFHGSGLLPFYAAGLGWHADPECNNDPGKVGGYVESMPLPKPNGPELKPITKELVDTIFKNAHRWDDKPDAATS